MGRVAQVARLAAIAATLAACELGEHDAPAAAAASPAPHWVYTPAPPVWLGGAPIGSIGRSQTPDAPSSLGIVGVAALPLHLATPWPVPGDGPARAIVYGLDGLRPAIELIDVDRGVVVWRDEVGCRAPVVGVTADAVVCSDVHGVRAVGLDGKPRWHAEATFIAMTDDHVVTAGAGEAVVLDAASGDELRRVKLPANVSVESVLASCGDAGAELFAVGRNDRLERIADAAGGPKLMWSVAIGTVTALDACTGDVVIATVAAPGVEVGAPVAGGGGSLVAIARATGAVIGRVDGVLGSWPARDGGERIEIATATGVASWPRALGTRSAVQAVVPVPLALPPLGELLARRGELRLVRATAMTAVLLDRNGVRAYLELAEQGAVLGDTAIVAASWTGSRAEYVHRVAIPPRYAHSLHLEPHHAGIAVAAELRDLPAAEPATPAVLLDRQQRAITDGSIGMSSVAAIAIDPAEPAALYAITLEQPADDSFTPGVAKLGLGKQGGRWHHGDACGLGTPVGLAFAHAAIVCGTDGALASVHAFARDGTPMWARAFDAVDSVDAAGDTVLARSGDRVTVLDAATGAPRGTLASADGGAPRVTVLELGALTVVIVVERGRLVARLPAIDMLPLWSLAIHGAVRALTASDGDGVLVELDDGDAYRVDGRTGHAVALASVGQVWRADHELITGESTDAASWQYTLFELGGGVHARNDYALAPPIVVVPASARGPAGCPLVVVSGAGGRDMLVLDSRTGDPRTHFQLADDDGPHLVFATVVDGQPVAGVVTAAPLSVILF